MAITVTRGKYRSFLISRQYPTHGGGGESQENQSGFDHVEDLIGLSVRIRTSHREVI